ncbi:BET1-like protein [Halotydeus destructor]|nr:BET1-like protein [Halotydeus destructor]
MRRGNTDAEDLIEQENRERAERLAAKVTSLKNFSIDIEHETKEHNRLLDGIDDEFDSTFGFITNGRNRVNRLLQSSSSNRKFMCYFSIAIAGSLLVVYYLLSRSLVAVD